MLCLKAAQRRDHIRISGDCFDLWEGHFSRPQLRNGYRNLPKIKRIGRGGRGLGTWYLREE